MNPTSAPPTGEDPTADRRTPDPATQPPDTQSARRAPVESAQESSPLVGDHEDGAAPGSARAVWLTGQTPRRELWLDVIAAALDAHLLDQQGDGPGVMAAIDRLLSRLAVAEGALPKVAKPSAEGPS